MSVARNLARRADGAVSGRCAFRAAAGGRQKRTVKLRSSRFWLKLNVGITVSV